MSLYLTGLAAVVSQTNLASVNSLSVLSVFDFSMLGILIFVFHRGIHRGFTEELSRFLGILISVAAGLFSLRMLDELISPMSRWIHNILPARFVLALLTVVGCFILWVVVENICAYCIKVTVSNQTDMLLGGFLGISKACIIILVVCCVCYLQPNRNRVDSLQESSWVFGAVQPLIEKIMKR